MRYEVSTRPYNLGMGFKAPFIVVEANSPAEACDIASRETPSKDRLNSSQDGTPEKPFRYGGQGEIAAVPERAEGTGLTARYCKRCKAKEAELFGAVLDSPDQRHDQACIEAGCRHISFEYMTTDMSAYYV